MTPAAHSGVEDSVRLLLTKNPARSFICPRCEVNGILFERCPRFWQTAAPIWGPFYCADSSLVFFKEVRLFQCQAVSGSLAQSRLMSRCVLKVTLLVWSHTLGLSDMSGCTA